MSRVDTWTAITAPFFSWRQGLGDGPGGVHALIAERPVSIVVRRQNSTTHASEVLSAQTVRCDLDTGLGAPQKYSATPSSGVTNPQKWIVLGYKSDPLGVADTDLKQGDVFLLDEQQVRVVKIEASFTDRLLAEAVADG